MTTNIEIYVCTRSVARRVRSRKGRRDGSVHRKILRVLLDSESASFKKHVKSHDKIFFDLPSGQSLILCRVSVSSSILKRWRRLSSQAQRARWKKLKRSSWKEKIFLAFSSAVRICALCSFSKRARAFDPDSPFSTILKNTHFSRIFLAFFTFLRAVQIILNLTLSNSARFFRVSSLISVVFPHITQ